MTFTKRISVVALAAWMIVLGACVIQAASQAPGPAGGPVTDIKVSFKLDRRLHGATYGGDLWVSPPTYTLVGERRVVTVEARAQVLDVSGKSLNITPKWIPEDPGMVSLAPDRGNAVEITVLKVGKSSLKLVCDGFTRRLSIFAVDKGPAIQVEISQ